jgi:hypothetical protein
MTVITTGINADVVVALDTDASAHAITLSLSGVSTHQLVPQLRDVAGNAQSATQPFCYISRSPATATVSATGLITAISRGSVIIECSYPWFNNSYPNNPDGTPKLKVFNEIVVSVRA